MSSQETFSVAKTFDLEHQKTISSRDPLYIPHGSANPAPLGLFSFATSIFLISLFNLSPRGVTHSNVIVGELIFFGGGGHLMSGIMEFIRGNTFGATVFSTYAAYLLSYSMIFIPATGIMAAYTDPATGVLQPEFRHALSMFLWAFFMLSVIFTVGAMRTSWVMLTLLTCVDVHFLLVACGHMTDTSALIQAASAPGLAAGACAYWLGASGLWGNGNTPFTLPIGDLSVHHN